MPPSNFPAPFWDGDHFRYQPVPRTKPLPFRPASLLDRDDHANDPPSLLDIGGGGDNDDGLLGSRRDERAESESLTDRQRADIAVSDRYGQAAGNVGSLFGPVVGAIATGFGTLVDTAKANDILGRLGIEDRVNPISAMASNLTRGLSDHIGTRNVADRFGETISAQPALFGTHGSQYGFNQAYDAPFGYHGETDLSSWGKADAIDRGGFESLGTPAGAVTASSFDGEGIVGRDQSVPDRSEQDRAARERAEAPGLLDRVAAGIASFPGRVGEGISRAIDRVGGISLKSEPTDLTHLGSPGLGGYGNLGTAHSYGLDEHGNLVGNWTGDRSTAPAPSAPSLADLAASLANAGDMSFSGQESGGGGGGSMSGTAGDPGADGGPSGPWRKGGQVGSDRDGKLEPVRGTVHETEVIIRPEVTQQPGVADALLAINDGTIPGEALVSLLDFYSQKKPESLLAG